MSARSRVIASLTATAMAAIGALAVPSPAQADTVVRGVTIPSFYTPPISLPAANGALVRAAPFTLALTLPSLGGQPAPGTATRIMYKSTNQKGKAVAVTGAYIEPAKKWTGSGPRPLIVVAAGTQGQGDQCAPSFGLDHPVTIGDGTFTASYESLAIYRLLNDTGAAVVVTDYVGLYGYSQGGGAVASAAELAATYAPDVPLKATYAGAPPADLTSVTKAIDGTELAGAIGWAVNGFVQTEPSFQLLLDKYLSDSGRAVLKDLTTMCTPDAISKYANQKSASWTTTGQSVADIIQAEPAIRTFVDSQRIGRIKPTGMVRVATGVYDNLVPHAQARTMASDWCKLGGNVVYSPINQLNGSSPLLNHAVPLLTDQGDAINWLRDRLTGRLAFSNCMFMPFMG